MRLLICLGNIFSQRVEPVFNKQHLPIPGAIHEEVQYYNTELECFETEIFQVLYANGQDDLNKLKETLGDFIICPGDAFKFVDVYLLILDSRKISSS